MDTSILVKDLEGGFTMTNGTIKRISTLLMLLFLTMIFVLPANAAGTYNQGTQIRTIDTGIIVCTGASLRSQPNARAQKVATLKNGTLIPIAGETGDFYIVSIEDMENPNVQGLQYGYVLKRYVSTRAFYITLTKQTEIWASTWWSNIAVGQKVKGTKMLVIDNNQEWLAVQINDGKAGVGFIRRSDLNYSVDGYWSNNQWFGANHAIVIAEKVDVVTDPYNPGYVVGTLKKKDIVKKLGNPINGYQPIEQNGYKVFVDAQCVIDIFGH